MSIEVITESLRLAVESSFNVSDWRRQTIEKQAANLSKEWLDIGLHVAKGSKQTGLRADVARALVSGDLECIAEQRKNVQQSAIRGICVRAMRQAVTIENNNRKRK